MEAAGSNPVRANFSMMDFIYLKTYLKYIWKFFLYLLFEYAFPSKRAVFCYPKWRAFSIFLSIMFWIKLKINFSIFNFCLAKKNIDFYHPKGCALRNALKWTYEFFFCTIFSFWVMVDFVFYVGHSVLITSLLSRIQNFLLWGGSTSLNLRFCGGPCAPRPLLGAPTPGPGCFWIQSPSSLVTG